jgi:hypothetical protein
VLKGTETADNRIISTPGDVFGGGPFDFEGVEGNRATARAPSHFSLEAVFSRGNWFVEAERHALFLGVQVNKASAGAPAFNHFNSVELLSADSPARFERGTTAEHRFVLFSSEVVLLAIVFGRFTDSFWARAHSRAPVCSYQLGGRTPRSCIRQIHRPISGEGPR